MAAPPTPPLRPREWVTLTAVIGNAALAEASMCLGFCAGGLTVFRWDPVPAATVALAILGFLAIAWGTLLLVRGAAGRPECVLPGLVRCLAGAGGWLVVAGWGLAWGVVEGAFRVPAVAWFALAPPLLLLALNGFLLAILRARPVTPDPDAAGWRAG